MWEFLRKLSYAACLPIEKLISMYTLEEICFWNYLSSRLEKLKTFCKLGIKPYQIKERRQILGIHGVEKDEIWNCWIPYLKFFFPINDENEQNLKFSNHSQSVDEAYLSPTKLTHRIMILFFFSLLSFLVKHENCNEKLGCHLSHVKGGWR